MGDKSLKAKQRDQKHKDATKTGSAAAAKSKQDSYRRSQPPVAQSKKSRARWALPQARASPVFTPTIRDMMDIARIADEAGFNLVWNGSSSPVMAWQRWPQ
jgi:hypothetical protein